MWQRTSDQWGLLAATRFILAMIVMLGHLDLMPNDLAAIFTAPPIAPPSFSRWWTHIGLHLNQGSAVFGFLLISGYSIAASLDRSEPGYFWRRVRRIYPVYVVSLAVTALAMFYGAAPVEPASRFLITILMLQTIIGPTVAADGQLWTIAVEWWNYMVAPIYRRLPDFVGILLICASLAAFQWTTSPANPAPTVGGLMFARVSWFWLVGFLYYRRRRTPWGYALLFVPLIIASNYAGIGRAAWIGAVALAFCEDLKIPLKLRALFRWLGDLSYPIYAMHIPVFVFCLHWGVTAASLMTLAVLAVSAVVLHAVDLPIRGLGRRRTQPAAAAAYGAAEA